jgi:hypothetical protein
MALLLAGCASAGVDAASPVVPPPSAPASPPTPAAEVVPVPEEASTETKMALRTLWEEEDALHAEGLSEERIRDYRLRWLEALQRFQMDPRAADSEEAFEDAVLVLSNLYMAEADGVPPPSGGAPTIHLRSRELLVEWHRRHPRSLRMGGMLDFIPPPSPGEEAAHRAFLDAFAASSWDPTARGALMARAGSTLGPAEEREHGRKDWEEVVRRWPDSFAAGMARRHLAAIDLRPGTEPPPLDLADLAGARHSLAGLRGSVVLLTFFGIT